MLEKEKVFAILLPNKNIDLLDIVGKISLRKSVHYNKVKFQDDGEAYILYNPDKTYLFDMARNKNLKLIWKDEEEFYIIDFGNNTKGDIICNLGYEDCKNGSIEGEIVTFNLKKDFSKLKKVMLISSKLLDEKEPYSYEHFCFFKIR